MCCQGHQWFLIPTPDSGSSAMCTITQLLNFTITELNNTTNTQLLNTTVTQILNTTITQHQAAAVAEVCDVVQIPAFLCRQTDLLAAAVSVCL
jgi:proline racemase